MTILRTTFLSLISVEIYPLAQIHRPSAPERGFRGIAGGRIRLRALVVVWRPQMRTVHSEPERCYPCEAGGPLPLPREWAICFRPPWRLACPGGWWASAGGRGLLAQLAWAAGVVRRRGGVPALPGAAAVG